MTGRPDGKLENRNGCIEMLVDEVENETEL
jgi:hypothetical protein